MTYKSIVRDVKKDRQTLQLLAEGKSRQQVADILCMSRSKLSYRVARLRDEFDAITDPHLIARAIRKGLIE